MSKEQFERTKPHVNIGTLRQRLQQQGMTFTGAQQTLDAQPITNSMDRELVARIVRSTLDDPASCWIRTQQLNTQG